MRSWFITQNEQTKGPFTQDEVKTLLADGSIPLDCQIWGRGQSEWVLASNWMKTSALAAVQATDNSKSEQAWHFAVQGVSKGPMSRAQLVSEIKALRDKEEVLVWTKGMKAWSDLFEFHDLLDEVGLNRRQHPRVGIEGQVVLRTDDGKAIIGQLKTISQGGFGVSQVIEPLTLGQVLNIEIRSPVLGEMIATKATIQYITESAFIGLKFVSISMESKARIVEYVRHHQSPAQQAA